VLTNNAPGEALFAPLDSGLYHCRDELDIVCGEQLYNWYSLLTNVTGVGLLMLHWVPGNWLNPQVGIEDLVSGEQNRTFATYLTAALAAKNTVYDGDLVLGQMENNEVC
jgi:hypothetical protein